MGSGEIGGDGAGVEEDAGGVAAEEFVVQGYG